MSVDELEDVLFQKALFYAHICPCRDFRTAVVQWWDLVTMSESDLTLDVWINTNDEFFSPVHWSPYDGNVLSCREFFAMAFSGWSRDFAAGVWLGFMCEMTLEAYFFLVCILGHQGSVCVFDHFVLGLWNFDVNVEVFSFNCPFDTDVQKLPGRYLRQDVLCRNPRFPFHSTIAYWSCRGVCSRNLICLLLCIVTTFLPLFRPWFCGYASAVWWWSNLSWCIRCEWGLHAWALLLIFVHKYLDGLMIDIEVMPSWPHSEYLPNMCGLGQWSSQFDIRFWYLPEVLFSGPVLACGLAAFEVGIFKLLRLFLCDMGKSCFLMFFAISICILLSWLYGVVSLWYFKGVLTLCLGPVGDVRHSASASAVVTAPNWYCRGMRVAVVLWLSNVTFALVLANLGCWSPLRYCLFVVAL